MVSTSFMVDTSSHPRAQLHRCVERSAYGLSAVRGKTRCAGDCRHGDVRGGGVRRQPARLKHDPEKCAAVFEKDHA